MGDQAQARFLRGEERQGLAPLAEILGPANTVGIRRMRWW